MFRHFGRTAVIVGALLVAAGCGGDDGGSGAINLQDYITAVTTLDGSVNATYSADDAPAASGGPTVTATGGSTVITGGSAQVALSASGEFLTVIVSIDGVPGSWRLALPATTAPNPELAAAAVTSLTLLITYAADIPEDAFTVHYQVGDAGGSVGAADAVSTSVVTVGTGEVQVSISWDTNADVDLHVVEPSDEEIYYGHRTSATGGELDLDSNVGCAAGPQNENITWESGAPSGTYIVRVDYFSDCDHATTNYVVTVRRSGHATQTYTGTLNAPGDAGGAGSGVQVTTFTY